MQNLEEFAYKASRWQDLYAHLKKFDFDVYSPGVKLGECEAPYLVIKQDGSSFQTFASTYVDLYTIMVFVPKEKYSLLDAEIQRVKRVMKFIEPLFYPTGAQTPSYYDDSIKAHMASITYKNYKKL